MFWKYCLRRITYGVMIFIIIIFIYAVIFNTVMEKTVKAQIEEQIRSEQMAVSASNMSPVEVQQFIERRRAQKYKLYYLDKPSFYRIMRNTANILTLHFGTSTHMRSSSGDTNVWKIIAEVLPRTILLFTTVSILEIIIGLWLGIKKAQKPGSFFDKSTSIATLVVYGMPTWWFGMLMIIIFAYGIKLFPSGGLSSTPPLQGAMHIVDTAYHMILPVITLTLLGFWGVAFLIRNIMLGILQEDFIMAARSRGISESKVLFGHGLRTAAPPITTMALLMLLGSVTGSIIFEGIFSWPGIGNLYWVAIEQNDVPVLMGSLFVTTGLYMSGLVALDLIYGFLDPRIKVGGGHK